MTYLEYIVNDDICQVRFYKDLKEKEINLKNGDILAINYYYGLNFDYIKFIIRGDKIININGEESSIRLSERLYNEYTKVKYTNSFGLYDMTHEITYRKAMSLNLFKDVTKIVERNNKLTDLGI